MKIQKIVLVLVLLSLQSVAFAHCPSTFKEEKVCMMLDKNMVFIYDHDVEHNGPYKDFVKADLTALKNEKGVALPFKKVARGIYKVDTTEPQTSLTAVVALDKKKTDIKLTQK
ncbi:MAG: hypothetical protein H7177_07640 [Rhizobacter sp.]|nr:hypothetical protein [Bacteriovorax sp.]